jgi:hypothetical protein
MANPDVSLLKAYGGTYQKQIIQKMYRELMLGADGILVMPNIKSKTTLTKLSVGKGLTPYTGVYNSEDGQISYAEREIVPELIMRCMTIDPKKYKDTWMAEELKVSAATNSNKKAQIPFEQYVWDAYMKENVEELCMALYHAKGKAAFANYSNATTYAAGALVKDGNKYYKSLVGANTGNALTNVAFWDRVDYLALFKGFQFVIENAIANEGFANTTNTGVITVNDAIAQFKDVYRALPETTRSNSGNINMYCSLNNFEKLLDAIGDKYKGFTSTDNVLYLPETNRKAIVKPVNWLSGSNRIIASVPNNLVIGTDQMADMNKMTFIEDHFSLESSLVFSFGTQVQDLDVMATNLEA